MTALWIFLAFFFGILLTGWAALIVQSLAGQGKSVPHFASEIRCHLPPTADDFIVLDADFTFVDSNGERWTAPKGMESDGASVGSLLGIPLIGLLVERLIEGTPLTGPLRPAAIAHDGMYARATADSFWPALISSARADADRIIYEAARCRTYCLPRGSFDEVITRKAMTTWRAFVVMAMLRLAGWKAWINDSRASRSLTQNAEFITLRA